MQHFKEFLIKFQTLDIKINERKKVIDREIGQIKFYDISHQNPYLSGQFKNDLKELKELAITDILNLPREQILFQLDRLSGIKDLFAKFWHNSYNSNVPNGMEHELSYFYSLGLHEIFISPKLYFVDNAITDNDLINDLQDSIRHRQEILKEFEEAVAKAIGLSKEIEKGDLPKETETSVSSLPTQKEIKAGPVFKEEIVPEFFAIIKNYFSSSHQELLLKLLTTGEDAAEPLSFNGQGNQLADAFKQLYLSNLVTSCNKSELESWIQLNFRYRDKRVYKFYSERYLQDIISTNTKGCQSPLFDVKKSEGQFHLSILHRNDKNQKR